MAAMALQAHDTFENKSQAKKNVKDAITAVAKVLGNTPAVCRKCYVHPAVLESYLDGNLIAGLKKRTEEALAKSLGDLRSEEAAVLTFAGTPGEKIKALALVPHSRKLFEA